MLDFTVFNPIAKCAPGIVTGHVIDALTDQFGDQQARAHFPEHGLEIVIGAGETRGQDEIMRTPGVTGGLHAQLACSVC